MDEYIERTEELMLAMNAGARAIENTKRYHGAVYTKDLFADNSQEIPYLLAAKVLRETSDAPAADVAPVVHGRWMKRRNGGTLCSRCGHYTQYKGQILDMSEAIACPWCGAMMGGGTE